MPFLDTREKNHFFKTASTQPLWSSNFYQKYKLLRETECLSAADHHSSKWSSFDFGNMIFCVVYLPLLYSKDKHHLLVLFEMWILLYIYITQAGLQLLSSSDTPALGSQVPRLQELNTESSCQYLTGSLFYCLSILSPSSIRHHYEQ